MWRSLDLASTLFKIAFGYLWLAFMGVFDQDFYPSLGIAGCNDALDRKLVCCGKAAIRFSSIRNTVVSCSGRVVSEGRNKSMNRDSVRPFGEVEC